MSAAVNNAVFNALDANGDGVISRAEFGGARALEPVTAMYGAPAATYSASPITYAAPTVMPAQTYGAPQAYMSAPTYSAPVQTMQMALPASVSVAAPRSGSFYAGGASVGVRSQPTYAVAPQAVTYAAAPAVMYADAFSAIDTNNDGVITRSEFAGTVAAPTYGAPAYSMSPGPTYYNTVAPTIGVPQGYTGGGAYTQGKVYEPVLFTQESFVAYQTQGASALPFPGEASVVETAAAAAAVVPDAPAKTPEASSGTKPAVASAKKSKKAKKASKKKKGCC